ncbi:MAG: hypothetical protein AAGA95_18850, partial [Pseudomonadota bacterium]
MRRPDNGLAARFVSGFKSAGIPAGPWACIAVSQTRSRRRLLLFLGLRVLFQDLFKLFAGLE